MTYNISFKSTPEYWKAEKDGLKCNTVRFVNDWDFIRWYDYNNATHIIMTNTKTGEIFKRKISHRCEYENIVIISWKNLESRK